MSIQALPQSTVRALGATQALTDPASLVKELLDNALDANANNVAVSISSNTLDVIQVRDNGHGIAPQDRPMVARRYCTSKICDEGDLKGIGGTSLGFRGEALASAAELSGTFFISTRIEGEQVATSLKISQQGEVVGQERASLPVGTTVRITDFIKANPVRRQVALRNVDICLKKIKKLLHSYAFARPQVRLSLQVLKAQNNKGDWIYAPKVNGNVEDAAYKIVGAQCALSCLWSVVEEQGLTLKAFLPRPDADASKISNIGSFVSIDARPVSTSRGLLKQIIKVFRESLKAANSKFDNIKDPFVFLEISGGAYDANLEPAKDDVLFGDADIVLQVAKQLFTAVYEPMAPPVLAPRSPASVLSIPDVDRDGSTTTLEQELLMSPSDTATDSASVLQNAAEQWLESTDEQNVGKIPASRFSSSADAPMRRSNMYGYDEEDLSVFDDRASTARTEADFAELRQSRNDVTLSNPWLYAKMNAPSRDSGLGDVQRSRSPGHRPPLAVDARRGSSPMRSQQAPGVSGLPTPRQSSPSPRLENRRLPDCIHDLGTGTYDRLVVSSSLPLPQTYTPASTSTLRTADIEMPHEEQNPASPNHLYMIGGGTINPNTGTSLSNIPDVSTRPRRVPVTRVNRPFMPPTKEDQREQVWFDQPGNMAKSKSRRARRANMDGLVSQGEQGDLEDSLRPLTPPRRNRDIRDFVGRDQASSVPSMIDRRNYGETPHNTGTAHSESMTSWKKVESAAGIGESRGFIPASELVGIEESTQHVEKEPSRVFKRRKTTDRDPLRELSVNEDVEVAEAEDRAEVLPAASKRAISRRRSSKSMNRVKSTRLPLERIPPGQATHKLALIVSTDTEQLRQLASNVVQDNCMLSYHEPAVKNVSVFGILKESDYQIITASLHKLLVTAGGGSDVGDSADLLLQVRSAFTQHFEESDDEEMLAT